MGRQVIVWAPLSKEQASNKRTSKQKKTRPSIQIVYKLPSVLNTSHQSQDFVYWSQDGNILCKMYQYNPPGSCRRAKKKNSVINSRGGGVVDCLNMTSRPTQAQMIHCPNSVKGVISRGGFPKRTCMLLRLPDIHIKQAAFINSNKITTQRDTKYPPCARKVSGLGKGKVPTKGHPALHHDVRAEEVGHRPRHWGVGASPVNRGCQRAGDGGRLGHCKAGLIRDRRR